MYSSAAPSMSPPCANVAARRRCAARSVGSIATADQRRAIAATRFPAWIIIAAPSFSASRSLRFGPVCGAASISAKGSVSPWLACRRVSSLIAEVSSSYTNLATPDRGKTRHPAVWLGGQRGTGLAFDLCDETARARSDRLERTRDVDAARRSEVRRQLLFIEDDRLPRRSYEYVDDEVRVRDRFLANDGVARHVAVVGDRATAIEPVIDVVRTIGPVVRDRDLTRSQHYSGVADDPFAIHHVTQDRSAVDLQYETLAAVLADRSVKAGLALDDGCARLTRHVPSV